MISAETLKKHPEFSKLNNHQLRSLADASVVETVNPGQFIFHKGEKIHKFYLVIKGEFEIIFETPNVVVEYETHGQPSYLIMTNSVIGTIKPGDFAGWSGLVSPFIATSGVRAKNGGTLLSFDCRKLLKCFESDCEFGFHIYQTVSHVICKRLKDIYQGERK